MRIVSFNNSHTGILLPSGEVLDISLELKNLVGHQKLDDILLSLPTFDSNVFEEARHRSHVILSEDEIDWDPPIRRPSKILCAVNNYQEHANEMIDDVFPTPLFFFKPWTTLAAHKGVILIPSGCERIDYELELALIIGKEGRYISASNAFDHIAGYTVFIDVSARDFMSKPHTWFGIKAWDTFGPLGPVMVTQDEIRAPQKLDMQLIVNNEVRMSSNTSQMVHDIPSLVQAASEVCTLLPGDIIATGTIHGVGSLSTGDQIEAKISKVGSLFVTVSEDAHKNKYFGGLFPRIYKDELKP